MKDILQYPTSKEGITSRIRFANLNYEKFYLVRLKCIVSKMMVWKT